MKHCNSCNLDKELTEFGKDKYRSDGFTSKCKQCRNIVYKKYRKSHPEMQKTINERSKVWRKEYYSDPARKRKYKDLELKKTFGIGIDEFDKMLHNQNGVCDVCYRDEKIIRNKFLSVDHNHETGKIRGLLCS